MLSSTNIKVKIESFLKPLVESLAGIGITPNSITVAGFLFSLISALFIAVGNLLEASVFMLLSGACDALDGMVARISGKKSRFGAFLDSFLDRYSDFFPMAAVAYLAHKSGQELLLIFALLSIAGSFSTSYARARAEALGVECKVGILERPERFFLILLALVSGYLLPFFLFLALLSNLTALQRLFFVARRLK
jgi:phosphatidylglycerophosphate synthase